MSIELLRGARARNEWNAWRRSLAATRFHPQSELPGASPEFACLARRRGKILAGLAGRVRELRIGRARFRTGWVGKGPLTDGTGAERWESSALAETLEFLRREGCVIVARQGAPDHVSDALGLTPAWPVQELLLQAGAGPVRTTGLKADACGREDRAACLDLYSQTAETLIGSVVREDRDFAPMFGPKARPDGLSPDTEFRVFRARGTRSRPRAYALLNRGELWEAALAPGDLAACAAVLGWLRRRGLSSERGSLRLSRMGPRHPLWIYGRTFPHRILYELGGSRGWLGKILDLPAFLNGIRGEWEARVHAAGVIAEIDLRISVDGEEHNLAIGRAHHFALGGMQPVLHGGLTCSSQIFLQLVLGLLPLECPGISCTGDRVPLSILFRESPSVLLGCDA